MKQSLQILAGTFVTAFALLVGFLWLADTAARTATAAVPASMLEVAASLFFLFGFVGCIACAVVLGVIYAGLVSLALEKNS